MTKLNRLFVLVLTLTIVSCRLLSADETPVTENTEVKPVEAAQSVEQQPEGVAETKPQETPAEPKPEPKGEQPAAKPVDKPPHKSKATFFIVVGIIVLGLGAIGAAHFLKNSQVSR